MAYIEGSKRKALLGLFVLPRVKQQLQLQELSPWSVRCGGGWGVTLGWVRDFQSHALEVSLAPVVQNPPFNAFSEAPKGQPFFPGAVKGASCGPVWIQMRP